MAKINWSKVVNYGAREIQIRMPGCPTHYTNVQRAMDTLKNPALWMFVVTVVLINTFISLRNLDNWGGFIRVTGIVSVTAVLYVSCHVGLLASFRKTHGRLLSAVLDIFNCSCRCFIRCLDGPDFRTL
jgi:hypothetical protein